MLYDLKEVSPHKYSLIKRAEGAASGVGESNAQIAEDILVFINKLSEKFKDTFDTVTDPAAYKKIYDSVQQMEPADLARVGALLGGGAVGFRRALAGDSAASVIRGVATGAVLGAASGYFLPYVLDTLVGEKHASFGQNPDVGAGHVKTSAIFIPLMGLLAAGAGIMGAYIYGQSVGAQASAEKYETQLQLSKQRLQEALKATKWSNPSNLFKLDRADAISTLAGGGAGSLLGYLYARYKNRGKDEDDEERVNPVVSSLIGGGVGSIVGLLARRAIAPPAATNKAG